MNRASIVEWESTIHVPVDAQRFEAEEREMTRAGDARRDVIFLFSDDTRLSERVLQRKRTTSRKTVLGYRDGACYPIVRTTSIETPVDILGTRANDDDDDDDDDDNDDENAAAIGRRRRVVRATLRLSRVVDGDVRVSVNREECELGARHYVEYEIEYEPESSYGRILEAEARLMSAASRDSASVVFSVMTLENIFSSIMMRVQMWHYFDPTRPYKWAYKWNGVKAKLIFPSDKPDTAFLWPDAANIEVLPVSGREPPRQIRDMCLLVEMMDDRLTLIEVIGAKHLDEVHTTEPSTNVALLDHLRDVLDAATTTIRVGERFVDVQVFRDAPKPDTLRDVDRCLVDGYIIVQDEMIIKWKPPTIDVKCVGDRRYVAGDDRVYELSMPGEHDLIYEMSHDGRVLRQRRDRLAPSTETECRMFDRSVDVLRREQRRLGPDAVPSSTER